jgi:hypothetical protein
MDSSRKIDLQELHDARKTAPPQYQGVIDKSIKNIMNESPQISNMRQNMINALRSGDTRAVKNFQHEIDSKTRDSNGGRLGW